MNEMEKIINTGKASIKDYKSIGVTGVTSDNLIYVNVNMKNKECTTKEQVQNIVNMVTSTYEETRKVRIILNKINEGTASIDDYDYIGIDGIKEYNVDTVNAILKSKNYEELDEIQKAVDNI